VNDRVEGLAAEQAAQKRGVAHVAFDKSRAATADTFEPVDDNGLAVAQVIENRYLEPGLQQLDTGM
jgi:hypothetical protein